jgi:hypothetical protein
MVIDEESLQMSLGVSPPRECSDEKSIDPMRCVKIVTLPLEDSDVEFNGFMGG